MYQNTRRHMLYTVYLSIYLSIYLSLRPSVRPPVSPSIHPSIHASIHASIHPPIHPCCSHLEHRASVKRFVSLQFLNLRQSVGLLRRGISPTQGRYLHKHRQTSMPRVALETTIPAFEGRRHIMP
jgi:hypothetical protein